MKKKRVYIATDELDYFESGEPKVFEEKEDVIDFCVKRNEENEDENWVWSLADFHYRN